MSKRELPEPPLRVLAKIKNYPEPKWWLKSHGKQWDCRESGVYAMPWTSELTVVNHPRNDPEAVAMIEQAKRKKP